MRMTASTMNAARSPGQARARPVRRDGAAASVAAIVAVACAAPIRGTLVEPPAHGAPAVARATTSEPGGVRVLANHRASGKQRPVLATSSAELAHLWSGAGLEGTPPAVNFATHVVIATNFHGIVDQPEIVGAHVDAAGVLVLDGKYTSSNESVILLGVQYAQVIAIPRALVGTSLTWCVACSPSGKAYRFAVPAPTAAASAAAPAPRPALERTSIAAPRGIVELPSDGHIALRSLDDGREVWVVQRAGGDISVALADFDDGYIGIPTAVAWNAPFGRFDLKADRGQPGNRWDSRGRPVDGGAPLTSLAFARVGPDRIAVGEPAALPDGVVEPRANAPALDGADEPYQAGASTAFDEIPDGQLRPVTLDLVLGLDGPARLCPQHERSATRPGCPSTAPIVTRVHTLPRSKVTVLAGPLAVRRRGGAADLVIRFSTRYRDVRSE
jgi:hypothetical protein